MNSTEMNETASFNNETLADIRKSDSEVIRIARTEYKGVRYMDIRVFFEPKDGGAYRPTRKGISMKEDLFREFARAVNSVEEMLAVAETV